MTAAPDIVLAEIPLGREIARIAITDYRGHRLLSVWRWYPDNGEMKPGRRGVTLPVGKLPDLAAAVNAALDRARADGLLPGGAQ